MPIRASSACADTVLQDIMQQQPLPKLLFGENTGLSFTTAEEYYEFVRTTTPATLQLTGREPGFSFKGAALPFPDLKIMTSASTACEISTHFTSPRFSLILPTLGHGTVGDRHHGHAWNAADNLLLNPIQDERTFTFHDTRAQVTFEVDPSRLMRTASSIMGSGAPLIRLSKPEFEVATLTERQRRLKSLLLKSLAIIDATGQDVDHLTRIGFEDVLIRLIAELVTPEDAVPAMVESLNSRRSQRALKLVCDMILAPGSSPMTMTEMENAPGITARALGYAFNERFGCSPQEWQRNHFLDMAHAELRQATTSSIKAVSRKFGFSTPQSFNRFYRRRFGQSPADTLAGVAAGPISHGEKVDYSI